MSKCIRCGSGGLFSKTNQLGLCPSCEKQYWATIPRLMDIINESRDIIKNSDNLMTCISRQKLIVEKVYEIKNFGSERFDVVSAVDPNESIQHWIELFEGALNDLQDIYNNFEKVILDILNDSGSASKKDIIKIFDANFLNAGESFLYDLPKSISGILKQMEQDKKVKKEKIGNKYQFSLI